MNPSYDSPFGSQNPGGQTGMPGGMFPNGQMPNNQMLNNQMSTPNGYFPNQPTVSSSSQGDIILNPGKPNKKLPVILAIVVALIAIVAIVVMSIINLNKPSASPTGVSTDAKVAFSRFANFITTGTEGDTFPTEEYDEKKYYSLEQAIEDHDGDYLEKANQMFTAYIRLNDSISDNLAYKVPESFKKNWFIIYSFANGYLHTEEDFKNYYLSNGRDTTYQQMNTERQELKSIEDEQAADIAERYYSYEELLMSWVDMLEQSGCVDNKIIDNDCANAIATTQEQISNIIEKTNKKDEADSMVDGIIDSFIQDLWTVAERVNNE